MLKRLLILAVLIALVFLALPALSAEQATRPAASGAAQAPTPALLAAQTAALAKLRLLAPPDAKFNLGRGALPAYKPTTVKKEISCGVYFSPPPNPTNTMATSPRLYWINNTGATLAPGVTIEWEVLGSPGCCKGVSGPTAMNWPQNPPSPFYFVSNAPDLNPPQHWWNPCKAWVISP